MANGVDIAVCSLPDGGREPDFETFLREQRSPLASFLRRRLHTEEDAQDATQESLMRMLRYGRTEPPPAWKPLLYRIATNIACDRARTRTARHADQHVSLEIAELISEEPSAEQQLVREQEMAMLRETIFALPEKCRDIFLLHMDGMTYADIAARYGLSQKMIEKYISRALAALRAKGKAYSETL